MYIKAQKHFKKSDPVLHKASLLHDIENVEVSKNLFKDLVRAIAGQQLSGKAADTIFGRLEKVVGKKSFSAHNLIKIEAKVLRECGFSNAKIVAITSLSKAVAEGVLDLKNIHTLNDVKVSETLTTVKGIGPWTAEMILMFSLGREDIFSAGDLGLKKGIMFAYNLKEMPNEKKIAQLSKNWKPYRTYAARILWRVADAKKVVKKPNISKK